MTNYYEIVTPPSGYPVTLEEVKEWLKADGDGDLQDDLINELIAVATDLVEKYTSRVFIDREIDAFVDNIGDSSFNNALWIQLDRAPVSSIGGVFEWLDGAADYSAYTDYELKVSDGHPRVLLYDGVNVLEDEKAYPMKVNFNAGYGTADDVPDAIKTAIKSLIDMIYYNRGDCCPDGIVSDLPPMVKVLLNPYRILTTFAV